MKFTHAIARRPGKNCIQGLSTANLGPPNYELILKQHRAYVETLRSIGLEVIVLDAALNYPDGYFVEDTAVVSLDVAVITNPGAEARKGEENSIAPVLSQYRKIERIQPPGTLDGGDVLMVDTHFFIGISERTNQEGAGQLGRILEYYGNTWTTVPVGTGLHLKSSINYIGKHRLLVTENFSNLSEINGYDKIIVDKSEAYAANTLWINDHLLMPKGFPNTKAKLETLNFEIIELEMSEVRKMDGGLTCLSIRF